jgi:Ala-tRNA(Pro) deacylase
MAIVERLQQLLDRQDAKHDVVTFPKAFTAQQVAHNAHVTGRRLAKVLVLRDDAGKDYMVVLPASRQFDAIAVREVTGRTGMRLENELELQRLFPDCELGAMPPFGHLYGLPMFVDRCLARQSDIFFEAGNHHELVHMSWTDYAKLAAPFRADGCLHEQLVSAKG